MAFDPLTAIRRRSREEWLEVPRENVTQVRIWIQEHPEQAAVLSFLVGAIVILLFRYFLIALALVVLIYAAIVFLAVPSSPAPRQEP